MKHKLSLALSALPLCVCSTLSIAGEGSVVAKIENPYVQQLEHELEYEGLLLDATQEQPLEQLQRFEYGQALSDRWLVEFGITAEELENDSLEISSFEIEAKYQLTEQGEFNNDWGLIFELEKENGEDAWGIGTTFIALHEWQNWIGTANFTIEYEFGNDVEDELETSFAGQLKYRYKPTLEPAIEVFRDEDGTSIGAALIGQIRLQNARKIYWETGLFSGISSDQPDIGLRVNFEYEFY